MSVQVATTNQDDDPALYKVILNANPSQPYMSGLPSASQYLPLIVRKDARSLRPVVTPIALGGLASSNSVSDGGKAQDDVMVLEASSWCYLILYDSLPKRHKYIETVVYIFKTDFLIAEKLNKFLTN
jgi:hypothetical protein